MTASSMIGTCNFAQPRANFGPRWTVSNAEENLARSFARDYDSKYSLVHSGSPKMCRIFAHEVPVNGFGIADLVTVSWATSGPSFSPLQALCDEPHIQPTVRAFEMKLSDWRRGFMQAHRYRFFADVAILVIPADRLPAVSSLDTFKSLHVGLWGYNESSKSITKVYTPRPKRPAGNGHREKAIARVFSAVTQDRSFA